MYLRVSQQSKQKQRKVCSGRMKLPCVDFRITWKVKGLLVPSFENILRLRLFTKTNVFFAWRVVEVIVLSQSEVSLGETMFQSAISIKFRVGERCRTNKYLKNSSTIHFQHFFNFTLSISRGNKICIFPGLIFLERFHFLNRSFQKMPDFGVNLGCRERKIPEIYTSIFKPILLA